MSAPAPEAPQPQVVIDRRETLVILDALAMAIGHSDDGVLSDYLDTALAIQQRLTQAERFIKLQGDEQC